MAILPPPPFAEEYTLRQHRCVSSLYDRFWSKVEIGGPDECWRWSTEFCVCSSTGYGRIGVGKLLPGPTVWDSHRLAYWLTFGPIEDGMSVDHLCHSRTTDLVCPPGVCAHRLCCNPSHLELVDWYENTVTRREQRKTRFKCGHPFENNRVKNGGSGRCAECHRENARRARAEGRRSA